jgi:hypothetical protein
MSDQYFFVLLLAVSILLPVIPAFIFFKYLPSDATTHGPFRGMKLKLGGAFAGYFVIFIVLIALVENNRKQYSSSPRYEVWHVTGQVSLGNGAQLFPSDISINPPNVSVSAGGTFHMDIPVLKNEGNKLSFPTLSIQHDGFNSVDVQLGDTSTTPLGRVAIKVDKNRECKYIRIQPLNLPVSVPYRIGVNQ